MDERKIIAMQEYLRQRMGADQSRQILPQVTPGTVPGGAAISSFPQQPGMITFNFKGDRPPLSMRREDLKPLPPEIAAKHLMMSK